MENRVLGVKVVEVTLEEDVEDFETRKSWEVFFGGIVESGMSKRIVD
jgi:hypothetical protein